MFKKKEKVLLYGSNLWYLGEGMLGPLFAIFAERIGGNVLDISWAWATYLFVTGIMFIFIGKLSDKEFKKEKLLVLGYFLNAIFTFSYLFVSTTTHLLIVQAGLGVALALASPTWMSLYAKYEDKKHDGYAWGIFGGESYIFTAIAIIVGGLVVTFYSFTILFIIMGIVQTMAAIYQAQILRKKLK